MKKIILTIIFLLTFILKSNADVMPRYLTSVNHWGIGIASTSNNIKIFEKDNSSSKIIQEISWNNIGELKCKNNYRCEQKETFLAFSLENNTALFSVEDENDSWIYICYDQRHKLFGWIKKDENTKYYNWSDFLITFGKKYGMYLFSDVPKNTKRLYAAPNIESGCVDSFILANKITPWLVRGNWVLAKVENYDGSTKTGWLHYRTDSGRLMGFVNLK